MEAAHWILSHLPASLCVRVLTAAFSDILRKDGIQGLYRGYGAALCTLGPASAIWWAMYEKVSKSLHSWRQNGAAQHNARTEAATPQPSAWEAADREMTTEQQRMEYRRKLEAQNDPLVHGLSGACAGAVSSALTNPLDIAKTRMQTQHARVVLHDTPCPETSAAAKSHQAASGSEKAASAGRGSSASAAVHKVPAARIHSNMFSTLVSVIREEGARALIRGMFPRMILHGSASAATFVVYEQVMRLAQRE